MVNSCRSTLVWCRYNVHDYLHNLIRRCSLVCFGLLWPESISIFSSATMKLGARENRENTGRKTKEIHVSTCLDAHVSTYSAIFATLLYSLMKFSHQDGEKFLSMQPAFRPSLLPAFGPARLSTDLNARDSGDYSLMNMNIIMRAITG